MTLDQWATRVAGMRRELLTEHDSEGLDAFADQHVLLGLAKLDEAVASLRLAALHEARALAALRGAR